MPPIRLETPRLVLRELEEADAAAVNVWESDPEVVRYLTIGPRTVEDSLRYVREVRTESASTPRLLFDLGVERREDRLLIGHVGLCVRRPEHREAEVWFVLRRDCQGCGYAAEAVRVMITYGFKTLGLHRIMGDCDPRNQASARLMDKLGMRHEGRLRENWWLAGEWCDSWIYAVLDHEWRG